jgi:hypothetical protein
MVPRKNTGGLPVPNDFEDDLRKAIYGTVRSKFESTHPEAFELFTGGWAGVACRYCACCEHDEAFTASFARDASYPGVELYEQGKHLFEFFVTGQSALECLCFGLYALGAMAQPGQFPIATEQDRRKVSPERTAARYHAAFAGHPLEVELAQAVNSTEYKGWTDVRNILAHRLHGSRAMAVMGVNGPFSITWHGFAIDQSTTKDRRSWLAKVVTTLFHRTQEWVDSLP